MECVHTMSAVMVIHCWITTTTMANTQYYYYNTGIKHNLAEHNRCI